MEDVMTDEIVIFGYGAVGRATADRLARQGRSLRIVQRHKPAALPRGASFTACDILDAGSVAAAVGEARQVVMAVGFPYEGAVWRASWPRAMANLLAACRATGARLVFVDNLYMYGPQREPLREDMPLADVGIKPAVRAGVTRQWMAAHQAGEVRVTALRAPDFYGPEVALSHLGDVGLRALARGKRATLVAPPDTPHDFAYVPDIARGVESLLDAPDDAYGQAWHIPCAPTRTAREILAIGARALGVTLRISAVPLALWSPLGLVIPFMREMSEMRFQWDRPYTVDARKFCERFWSDPTPFERGASEAALSWKDAA
jgi:nucleoside-diphosphate-sugar epimerase